MAAQYHCGSISGRGAGGASAVYVIGTVTGRGMEWADEIANFVVFIL